MSYRMIDADASLQRCMEVTLAASSSPQPEPEDSTGSGETLPPEIRLTFSSKK